ncbi:VPLPA-CTERM sorting domain-containing protein [uncultured Shimia sp.]|uniref:VPLPA-CTERM sorting domain-containing protein n=1 Tax=uncultured Shimia sp. TaxID=573152 RepID=UPI00260D508E|nr:VPLPA-CTERM sorting domain-containing protein [uncultured Shimia sp.]
MTKFVAKPNSSGLIRNFLAVFVLAFSVVGTANAATTNFGPVYTYSTGASVSVDVAVDSSSTILTGFDLILQGDFSYPTTEYLGITIDGVSIGTIFDGNTSNDPFNFLNDTGNDFGNPPLSGSASLNLDISSLASDGFLKIIFQTGPGTNFSSLGSGVFSGETFYAAFQGSLTTDSISPVPLPAAGFLLLAGLGGLGALRRKKKS